MSTPSKQPVAVVIGVGPGLGASLVRRFAAAYAVAMLARNADYLKALAWRGTARAGPRCWMSACDVSDPAQIAEAFRAIRKDLGEPEVLLYNAGTRQIRKLSRRSRPSSTKRTGGSTPSGRSSQPRKSRPG